MSMSMVIDRVVDIEVAADPAAAPEVGAARVVVEGGCAPVEMM
jgi:hypothetical protein